MESTVIEKLLQKYLEAETSLQEEERLRAYFCSGNVAPDFEEYIPLFSYFNSSKEARFEKEVSFDRSKRKIYSLVAVAASIVILLGIAVPRNSTGTEFGTYQDPELAMQKTVETLELVSQLMNNGTEDLEYLEEFNNSKQKILNPIKQ